MATEHRQQKITGLIMEVASEFLARESASRALITVTRAEMTPDLKKAILFLSVLPESKEEEVMRLVRRERTALRAYLTEHSRFHPTPTIDFVIDEGEKNRRRIDELTRNKK